MSRAAWAAWSGYREVSTQPWRSLCGSHPVWKANAGLMEFVRAMQDIVAGNFKGFALLRQLALSAPESQAGTTSSSPPKPMYIRVRLHNPACHGNSCACLS